MPRAKYYGSNLRNIDTPIHRLKIHFMLAAVVHFAGERTADQVLFDLEAELVVDGAVDRAPLDPEGRLAVELDVDGAVDRLCGQVAAQKGLLGKPDGAVDGLEGAGKELAGEIDLAVHGLEGQFGELAGAIDPAVDRLELGPGQLLGDGDGEIDLGLGVALIVLDLDAQLVTALLEEDLNILYFPFFIGLLDRLDVDAGPALCRDLDLAVDVREFNGSSSWKIEALAYFLFIILGIEP